MMAPMAIFVTRSAMPPLEEYIDEIAPMWESRWLTNFGEKHEKLRHELCRYLKVQGLSLFTNGHQALECALEALEIKGEVITTPFTFASTTHAIVRTGSTPVFCDINENDYTIDVNQIEVFSTENTKAIVPVHVYGNPCDVQAIQAIADKHDLKIIYDAAHAFGVEVGRKGIGDFGDASMFSFHATKVFHTIEGGAVAFQDSALGERLNQWKNFGIVDEENVEYIGGNAKMNEFCAAMGLCNLRHIAENISLRQSLVMRYRKQLENVPGVGLCHEKPDVKYNYSYFPIVIDRQKYGESRDVLWERLKKNGIVARKYFYPLTSDFACYKEFAFKGETPVAKRVAANVLTLPLYPELAPEDVDRICDVIKCRSL